jgi:hypothetical protein
MATGPRDRPARDGFAALRDPHVRAFSVEQSVAYALDDPGQDAPASPS